MSATGRSGVQGFAPQVMHGAGNPEALKYGKLWEHPQYRAISPGEHLAQVFLQQARPRKGADVIDFGCGTGRGALMLALLGGLRVTMVDFVNNCLDPEIREALTSQADMLRFIKHDLEKPLPFAVEYGFCCDVMEHIPPNRLDRVLDNILHAAQHVFFSISCIEDTCGVLIGEKLHLSQHPFAWWLDQFNRRDCVIHWSRDEGEACLFYVSAWQDGQKIVDAGVLNVGDQKVRENVRHNCSQGWQQVSPHETNDLEVMILGGGSSLNQFESEIRQKRREGVKLITLNGAYNWCVERNLLHEALLPSAQIVVDARPFNARFTRPVVDGCKYLIASQCDPSVLEGLPKDRTYLWHTTAEMVRDILNEAYELWWAIPGGSTVLLRAIPLLRMLGYRKFHLYGCDSCLADNGHHAYPQPENDSEGILNIVVQPSGRIFRCHPWMLAQAQEMMGLIKFMGDEIELEIHGDGLLSHILEAGASFAMEE